MMLLQFKKHFKLSVKNCKFELFEFVWNTQFFVNNDGNLLFEYSVCSSSSFLLVQLTFTLTAGSSGYFCFHYSEMGLPSLGSTNVVSLPGRNKNGIYVKM